MYINTFLANFEQQDRGHFLSRSCRSSSWLLVADSLYACCSDGCVVRGGAEHTETCGVRGARGLSGVGGPFGRSLSPSPPPRSLSTTSSLVIITDGARTRLGLKIVGKSPSLAILPSLFIDTHHINQPQPFQTTLIVNSLIFLNYYGKHFPTFPYPVSSI